MSFRSRACICTLVSFRPAFNVAVNICIFLPPPSDKHSVAPRPPTLCMITAFLTGEISQALHLILRVERSAIVTVKPDSPRFQSMRVPCLDLLTRAFSTSQPDSELKLQAAYGACSEASAHSSRRAAAVPRTAVSRAKDPTVPAGAT